MEYLEKVKEQLKGTNITLDTIEKLVGKELSYKYIISCEERLNKAFEYLYRSMGFNNFYDMYAYYKMDGDKGISKTILKDGKKVRIYEEIDKDIVEKSISYKPQSYKNLKTSYAYIGKHNDVENIKDKVNNVIIKDIVGYLEGDIIAQYYDEKGNKVGITFFDTNEKTLEVKGYIGDRSIRGLGVKSIKEGLNLSKTEGKKLIISKDFGDNANAFLKSIGMKEEGNHLYLGE